MKGCGVVLLLPLGGSCGNCGLENMLTRKVSEATWDQASQHTVGGGLAHALQHSLLQRVIVVVTKVSHVFGTRIVWLNVNPINTCLCRPIINFMRVPCLLAVLILP